MVDYADKRWFRPKPRLRKRIALFVVDMVVVLLILVMIGYVIQRNEARAARAEAVLLEPSAYPATLDECQRTHKTRPRPVGVISRQNGSGTPWHHRICFYA